MLPVRGFSILSSKHNPCYLEQSTNQNHEKLTYIKAFFVFVTNYTNMFYQIRYKSQNIFGTKCVSNVAKLTNSTNMVQNGLSKLPNQ